MKSLKNNYRDYSYKDHKGKSFAKPQVKTEYDALQPEYDIIRASMDEVLWRLCIFSSGRFCYE